MLFIVVLPSVIMGQGANSMAAGLLVVALVGIMINLILSVNSQDIKNIFNLTWVVAILSALIFISTYLTANDEIDFVNNKFYQSIFLLNFIIYGAFCYSSIWNRVNEINFSYIIKFCFYILMATASLSILGVGIFHNSWKQTFFFSEPSFFAINIAPFYLYILLTSKDRIKLFNLIWLLSLALLFENLTLIIVLLTSLTLIINFKKIIYLFIVMFLSIIILSTLDLSYYSERLSFSIDSDNISTLAFLSGWERIFLTLREYRWLGVGFQQFGFIGEQGSFMDKLNLMGFMNLNSTDGSFLASKFIGEFGILAFIAILFYLKYFINIYLNLRHIFKNNINSQGSKSIFFQCVFLMYVINLFIRETGYFTSSGFMFLSALIWFKFYGVRINRTSSLDFK